MARPGEDDTEAVDRAFAEMMAGYHLTSNRPDPLPERSLHTDPAAQDSSLPPPLDTSWADAHPLFSFPPPPAGPASPSESAPPSDPSRSDPSLLSDSRADGTDDTELEPFVPPQADPLPRPTWPVLVAWLALGYSLLMLLAIALGFVPPPWLGGLALLAFVGSLALLFSRLPRHRPPDAGDGAVL